LSGLFVLVLLAALVGVFRPYINGIKRWQFGLAAFVAFILVGVFAEPTSEPSPAKDDTAPTSPNSASDTSNESSEPTAAKAEEPQSEWSYSTEKDEMRGAESRFAQAEATNTIDLDFPYGEQRGRILVRQSAKFGFDILVGVPSGQIMCNSYSNSHVSVKFDDGPIRRYSCADASDGSNSMVFIQDAKSFLANLKKSKRVVVEAEFFQNGLQQMTFNTANLKWEN
jgi:hypothetical protein